MKEKLFQILGMLIGAIGIFILIINYLLHFIPEDFHFWIVWLSAFSAVAFTFRMESDNLKAGKLYAHRISGYMIIVSFLALASAQGISGDPIVLPSWYLPIFIWMTVWFGTYFLFLMRVVEEEDADETELQGKLYSKILSAFIAVGSIAMIAILADMDIV